jgi:LacI family transcriptional regulator
VETTATILNTGMNKGGRPSALICANDDMAVGALFSAHKVGLNIPQDLSIVGFDDTPVSEIIWPPLTTVNQPLKTIGYRAVEMIVERIKAGKTASGPLPVRFDVVAHKVVMRESASKPQG